MFEQASNWQLDSEMFADVENGANGFMMLKTKNSAKCFSVAGQLPL